MIRNAGHVKWGIILIVIGLIFLLNNYGILEIGDIIGTLWPLILIFIGLSMLRRRHVERDADGSGEHGGRIVSMSSQSLDVSSVFSDIRFKARGDEFSGGYANNVFGLISIDLGTITKITGNGRMELHSVFGDIVVHLPENIALEVSGKSIFGCMTAPDGSKVQTRRYRTPGSEEAVDKLSIRVSQVFGDILLIQ